jgi:CRISPR-associated endonuclease/helicase Cas3
MTDVYAHSRPGEGVEKWEPLRMHLNAVADTAARYSRPFGWPELSRLAGLLHDIGKLSPQFQAYLRNECDSGGDHSIAGARLAMDRYGGTKPLAQMLAVIVAAHHAGLPDRDRLEARISRASVPSQWKELIGELPKAEQLFSNMKAGGPAGFTESFLIRMLYSCLVDADFLETERFYDGAVARGGGTSLAILRDRLNAFMADKSTKAGDSAVNRLRAEVLAHVRQKAALTPGLFTLTVPTGGGKTLASLSFALDHAVRHGLSRIIYVIPYTSIIEQTAKVFRDALATDTDILEHHASFDWERFEKGKQPDDADGTAKLRRAAENWDVPIVVTTAVQFFESLFANRSSRCRKLHNIANSVVVLDEAQTLPIHLLRPCLAALDELARNYHTSVVLCTATQPAIKISDGFKTGLAINAERELAPDPTRLYDALKRVAVESRGATTDEEIATRFRGSDRMLCIVNGRQHAQALFGAIRDLPGAYHLTTFMCPRHRRIVLDTIRARLEAKQPVRLVATSLIEAGVDVDFPEVWRAAAGLESIAQAAGRCNREGTLDSGRVVVFEPAEQKLQHEIAQRWQATAVAWRQEDDLLGLGAVRRYFREFYWSKGDAALDVSKVNDRNGGILDAIRERARDFTFPFAGIAQAFRLIDDIMEPVIVPWKANAADTEAEDLLARIAAMERPRAVDLRRLQQYTVPIPPKARDAWLARGVLRPVHPTLGEALLRFDDLAHYDGSIGINLCDSLVRNPACNIIT